MTFTVCQRIILILHETRSY